MPAPAPASQALGLDVPRTLPARADEVIESSGSNLVMLAGSATVMPSSDYILRGIGQTPSNRMDRNAQRAAFWIALISVSPPFFLQYAATAFRLVLNRVKSKTGWFRAARK